MRFNHPEVVHIHPAHLASRSFRIGSIHSNHPELMLKNSTYLLISAIMLSKKVPEISMCLNTPCYFCNNVVREDSRRFDGLELSQTSALEPCSSSIPFKDVFREGSVQSNHPNSC